MSVKRIVPNIVSTQADLCQDFYTRFLGLQVGMDQGWIATYVSPANPSVQISVIREDASPRPAVSMEVGDVDRVYLDAVARGYPIVYPLTDEPWGVRRFFVADPSGVVVNILGHAQASATDT